MPEFLTLALAAPLASMGDLAVGERRPGADRPARSAILGLVAACLGIDRADDAAHARLECGLAVALGRPADTGPPLVDYHSAQASPRKGGGGHATRRAELEAVPPHELSTVLTWRHYAQDALAIVALGVRPGCDLRLEDVCQAMERPAFTPSFGRRSCPLALPMAPRLLEHPDIVRAVLDRAANGPERGFWRARGGSPMRLAAIHCDPGDLPPELPEGINYHRRDMRRDAVHSRARWQFDLRPEAVLVVGVGDGA